MNTSRIIKSMLCCLLISSSSHAMEESAAPSYGIERLRNISLKGNPIPIHPDEELTNITANVNSREADFNQAKEWEQEGTLEGYQKAAQAYQKAGLNGYNEAFIHLGYLYEQGKLYKAQTIEEKRLLDAIAGYYIEKGGATFLGGQQSRFHFSDNSDEEEQSETEGQSSTPSLTDIRSDNALHPAERFFKIGQWYEQHPQPEETVAEKRLRYAYAARHYEEAALYYLYPQAFTALGHMYYFGRGIDISDMPLSACLQAEQYYIGHRYQRHFDPESQFMMGYLSEQDQTPEADHKASFYYQQAASAGHTAAAFRLGVRAEHGQEDLPDIAKFYQQAAMYYNQVLEGQKPSALIMQLVGMPENLEHKTEVVKKLQQNPEGLEVPVYGLLETVFRDHLRETLPNALMPYWVNLSLTRYAHDQGLAYNTNPDETAQRVKEIATLLSGSRSAQLIPGLTSHEQKMLNIQSSKNPFSNPAAQQMRMMQIRQYLGQEDENWRENPQGQSQSHVHNWFQKIQDLVTGINNLYSSFEGEAFLTTLMARIQALPTADHTLNPSVRLWPQGYEDSLTNVLATMKHESQNIFKALKLHEQSLSEQLMVYKSLQKIKQHIGAPFSDELLKDTLLAHFLLKQGSKDQVQEEAIVKHFYSARALKEYALSHGLSLEEAQRDLDQKARTVLAVLSPQLHDFSQLGYDVITKLALASASDFWTTASHNYRERLRISLNQGDLDRSWLANRINLSYLSGKNDLRANSLTQLFEQAKTYINQQQSILPSDQPSPNLLSLTYEDPYIGLYGSIVSDTFKDLQAEALATEENSLGVSGQELYEFLLDREILNIRQIISQTPGIGVPYVRAIDNIISVLENSSRRIYQKIDRKQNFLFTLIKSVDWQNSSPEEKITAVLGIVNGTEGRCPDGQASFFQDWILEYILNNLSVEDYPTNLQLGVRFSALFQDYKRTFIEKHTSPFTLGGDSRYNANEDRTAMSTLLTQMLRLPLNLTGSYNTVLYPDFAVRTLENKEKAIQIQTLIKRYIEGGEINHQDRRVTQGNNGRRIHHDIDEDGTPETYRFSRSFAPLTFKTLGKEIRESFVLPRDREPILDPLPGLLPELRLSFVFPQELMEKFLKYDPVLASFHSTFINSGYSQGNIFFDGNAAFEKGYHLKHILKDAAILRILEVAGYAKVPQGFYENLSEEWHF